MAITLARSRAGATLARLAAATADLIYPPRCLACAEATDAAHGLCAACWRDTHFIAGAACGKCGVPLVGAAEPDDVCESCLKRPPAWDRGAAAVLYAGTGRRVALALKHGDRLETVGPLARWMAGAGRALIAEADLIAPVPLHWRRLVERRFNQSAELARRIGRTEGKPAVADLLARVRMTRPQERMDRATRTANQAGAITVRPRRRALVAGRAVLVVDDVMTTGATLSACAEALRSAGAARVDVLVLARVAFEDSPGL